MIFRHVYARVAGKVFSGSLTRGKEANNNRRFDNFFEIVARVLMMEKSSY